MRSVLLGFVELRSVLSSSLAVFFECHSYGMLGVARAGLLGHWALTVN